MKIDMDYISGCIEDLDKFIAVCPNPTVDDVAKMMSIQAAVMQAEGLHMLAESREMPGAARLKRVMLATELLNGATNCFNGAAKILAKMEVRDQKFLIELEARRIANSELLEAAMAEGVLIQTLTDDLCVPSQLKLKRKDRYRLQQ